MNTKKSDWDEVMPGVKAYTKLILGSWVENFHRDEAGEIICYDRINMYAAESDQKMVFAAEVRHVTPGDNADAVTVSYEKWSYGQGIRGLLNHYCYENLQKNHHLEFSPYVGMGFELGVEYLLWSNVSIDVRQQGADSEAIEELTPVLIDGRQKFVLIEKIPGSPSIYKKKIIEFGEGVDRVKTAYPFAWLYKEEEK